MSKKLTEQRLFNPLIKWIDRFYDTVENTSLFKEDDELIEEFGVASNNFDIRELTEDNENTKIPDFIKDSMGDNEEIIQLEHEEFLEMIGFTSEQIEEDRKTVEIIDYNIFFSTEKATVIEFLANGGTITIIHDGENITREFIFSEEE